jgi:hypothetical protein
MKITPPPVPHRAPTIVGGDLEGSAAAPVVSGVQGTPVSATAPTTGQVLAFDGTDWTPTTPVTGAVSPLTTKGDLWGYSTLDARVPAGTNGYPLVAASAVTLGVQYGAITAVPAYPFHSESLTDGASNFIFASGDVVTVVGVPN